MNTRSTSRSSPRFPSAGPQSDVAELVAAGLLTVGGGCRISPLAVFEPFDHHGEPRPIALGDHCTVGAFAVLHGGVSLGESARIEERTSVGVPELGYAVGRTYTGAGAATVIAAGSIVRAGAIVYAGAALGVNSSIGHHTLVRSETTIGAETLIGHSLTIERACRIGDSVRCSPQSHITSSTHVGNRVFLGAGIRTVNDKELIWRDPEREPDLRPPRFEDVAKVGSGSTILGGVTIGAGALVGAGSVVTRDVPPHTVAYGSPARVRRSFGSGQ